MKLKFLGTGTSQGIPVIGCECAVCTSSDARNSRLRTSAIVTTDSGKKILIDCGPDFRWQMLQQKETQVDAVLLTHEHNDHVIGLDDLRPLIFRNGKDMDIYCLERVAKEIVLRFPYAFAEIRYPGAPSFQIHTIKEELRLFDTSIIPIEVKHNQLPVLGFRFKNLAYITDASSIPPSQMNQLKNLDILIINCLRKEHPHPSHFILPEVLQIQQELQPKKMYLTHIAHQFGLHEESEKELPKNVLLAYDGLELQF